MRANLRQPPSASALAALLCLLVVGGTASAEGPLAPLPAGAAFRLGALEWRAAGEVKVVAFAPDGRALVSAGEDALIRFWDLRSGREVKRFQGHEQGVRTLAFSPDGKVLASGSYDQSVRLWETESGLLVQTLRSPRGLPLALAFSPDGKTLASAHRVRAVHLWDVATGKELRQLQGHTNWVMAVTFSPDGQTLASAGRDRMIRIWKRETGEELRRIEAPQTVNAVVFSGDGKALISAGSDGVIFWWDPETGQELRRVEAHRSSIYTLALQQNVVLASGSADGSIRTWEVATGKAIRTIETPGSEAVSVAIAPDGKLLASAALGRQTVHLWNAATGADLTTVNRPGHEARITSLVFSPDGRALASGSSDRSIRLWELKSGKSTHKITGPARVIADLAFSADGQSLAALDDDHRVFLWQVASGKEQGRYRSEKPGAPFALTFGADGMPQVWISSPAPDKGRSRFMFSGIAVTPYDVQLIDLATAHTLRTFSVDITPLLANAQAMAQLQDPQTNAAGHLAGVGTVSMARNGTLLATGSHDTTIGIWRMGTGKLLGKLTGHVGRITFVGFTADDRTILTADDEGSIRLWETASRTEVVRLAAHVKGRPIVALAPDGRKLAWAGPLEQAVHIWDVTSGKESRLLEGHTGMTTALAFAPDGRLLASGGADSSILLWNVAEERRSSNLPPQPSPARGEGDFADWEQLWTALGSGKASIAYPAMWQLAWAPGPAVAFLKQRMQPEAGEPAKPIAQVISDLDDNKFAVRAAAQELLQKYGELAEPELIKALQAGPSLETTRRIEEVLAVLERKRVTALASPEELRPIRSVQVLEWIASPEARVLLKALAQGNPWLRQTHEAKASLGRLGPQK